MIAVVEAGNAGILSVSVVKETVPRDLEVQRLRNEISTKNVTSFNRDRVVVVRGERVPPTVSTMVVEEPGAKHPSRRKISIVTKRDLGRQQDEQDRRQQDITMRR